MEGLRDKGEDDGGGGGGGVESESCSALTQGCGVNRLVGNPARGLRYRKLEAMQATAAGSGDDETNHEYLLVRAGSGKRLNLGRRQCGLRVLNGESSARYWDRLHRRNQLYVA